MENRTLTITIGSFIDFASYVLGKKCVENVEKSLSLGVVVEDNKHDFIHFLTKEVIARNAEISRMRKLIKHYEKEEFRLRQINLPF